MTLITIVLGAFLSLVGVVGFVATGSEHFTALIPTGFGIVFLVLGVLARQDKLRMQVMHLAVLFGLGCFLGTVMGVPNLVLYLSGEEVARPASAVSQSLTALACLVYVVLCVRSFVEARRRRRANEAVESRAG